MTLNLDLEHRHVSVSLSVKSKEACLLNIWECLSWKAKINQPCHSNSFFVFDLMLSQSINITQGLLICNPEQIC